ncbi:hypothetical protein WISP_48121 [Willisornis vidua]|uniref:Uncharacterized protein n=1 Tax=Willisornis vidua TaxID=1566151 RepID=A0ABQ9DHL9_9PASS|nr:hypothetical protein WISP_48121 [Willisornis vidua]
MAHELWRGKKGNPGGFFMASPYNAVESQDMLKSTLQKNGPEMFQASRLEPAQGYFVIYDCVRGKTFTLGFLGNFKKKCILKLVLKKDSQWVPEGKLYDKEV